MTIDANTLAQFTGTEGYWTHPLYGRINYTDGVKYVADNGAAWLIDKIAITTLHVGKLNRETFLTWTLTKSDGGAQLVCTDGNDTELFREIIGFTDFPLETIKLFLTNNILMLPSEY